jgi:hypothetical protein
MLKLVTDSRRKYCNQKIGYMLAASYNIEIVQGLKGGKRALSGEEFSTHSSGVQMRRRENSSKRIHIRKNVHILIV